MVKFRYVILLALIFAAAGIVGTFDLEAAQMEARK